MVGRKPQPPVAAWHLRLADLRAAVSIDLRPDDKERAAIAARLEVISIPKLRMEGRIAPQDGGHVLRARLGATVIQPCSVTLAPMATRIDEDVIRRYLPAHAMPDEPNPGPGTEVEMPEDDTLEAAPEVLDLSAVLEEALALALPAFPRAPGADLGTAVFAAPGLTPLTDEAASPFAVLKTRARSATDPDEDEPAG